MKQKLLYTLMFSSVLGLQACGGGGGGGGGSYLQPDPTSGGGGTNNGGKVTNPSVPFSTPQFIETVTPLSTTGYHVAVTNMFQQDLTGSGANNVILAGRESSSGDAATNWQNSKLFVYGWNNGQLVDQTNQWFAAGANIITGTEPSVKFGNFVGNAHPDMFVAPGTDGNAPTNDVAFFLNNGSSFTRKDIILPYDIWSHGSTTFKYNGLDAVAMLDYGPNSTFIFGNPVTKGFTTYSVNTQAMNGSAIAAGDFLGNGTTTFVVADTANAVYSTRLFNWGFNNGQIAVNDIGTLPMPVYEQSQYDSLLNITSATGQNRSHNLSIITDDFDESGVPSVVIVSAPAGTAKNSAGQYPTGSQVQFLKNNGAGTFTDVTNSVLKGYNSSAAPAYNPIVIDLLNNGLSDIVLAGTSGATQPAGLQVLMQVSKGQYVASFANVISDFQNQVKTLAGGSYDNTNTDTATFVVGPSNNLYLLDMISTTSSGLSQKSLYLSQMGSTSSAMNAGAVINAIKQQWPWLTDASANAVLAATGKTWFGATIIDDNAALNSPFGSLSVATAKGNTPISGYITGVNFGDNTNLIATDYTNRSFSVNFQPMVQHYQNSFNSDTEHIDQYDITSHTEYLINGPVNTYGPLRVGSETRNMYNTLGGPNQVDQGPTLNQVKNYSIGIPYLWSNGSWSAGVQYTTLNYNPWTAFGGSWGMITQTGNIDHTIRYNNNGFSAVVGGTYTSTQMTPGLITKVNDIYGVWGETGYRWQNNLGIYAGVKPVVVSGSIQANLPAGIDNAGNMQYTGRSLALQNQTTGYVRALWGTEVNKHTSYRVSGTAMTNGQYRLMNELRYSFD